MHIFTPISNGPITDQTRQMEGGNRLTAGQGRNKDEHMRILNASATNLADAINYTGDQQTPEATHVELLNNNIGSDTWGSKLGEQIP